MRRRGRTIAFSTVIGRLGGLIYALRKASIHEAARIRRGLPQVPLVPDIVEEALAP